MWLSVDGVFSNRCRIVVCFGKFSGLASVSSNKVGVVVACSFEKMRSRYLYSSDKMSGVSKSVVLVLSKSG